MEIKSILQWDVFHLGMLNMVRKQKEKTGTANLYHNICGSGFCVCKVA